MLINGILNHAFEDNNEAMSAPINFVKLSSSFFLLLFVSSSLSFTFGQTAGSSNLTVKDIDGNVYKTVTIGTQVWMAENLRVSRYRNGDIIPNVTAAIKWKELTTGSWCFYKDDAGIEKTYGRLYNWYAASDSRGLCPEGWRMPSYEDFQLLLDNSGGIKTAGTTLKSTSLWQEPNAAVSNSFGFSVLPSGFRFYLGKYSFLGHFTGLWSSDSVNDDFGWILFFDRTEKIRLIFYGKKNGFSCRCIKG